MSSNLKLNKVFSIILLVVLISFCFSFAQGTTDVITPEQNFGFTPGSDRMLFTYEDLVDYLQKLDQASPKLKMVEIGNSPHGRTMYIAFISSEANINNLDKVKNSLTVAPIILKEEQDISTEIITLPRVALVETYFHDMDAGWTRYVFDTYQIPYKVLRPGDFEKTDLVKSFDLIVFPNSSKSLLMEGKRKSRDNTYYVSSYPPEFTKGIGKKGMERLMTFLDNGGTIVSWGRSADLFIGPLSITKGKDEKEEFQLPVRNIADQVRKAGFYAPGSLVKILLKENHPLTYGMEKEIGVFYRGNPVFTTSFPNFDMDRRVIAKFPEDNILMSGYVEKEKQIANKTAMVWLKKGKGQLVLFAFNPQFRASTHVSYKLMFNSLLLPKIK